jgi:hypothetical protein
MIGFSECLWFWTLSTYFSLFYVYRIPVTGILSLLSVTRFWSERGKVLYVPNTTVYRLDSLGQGNVMHLSVINRLDLHDP